MSGGQKVTFTARIDAAVLEAANQRGRAARGFLVFFAVIMTVNLVALVGAAMRGSATQASPALYVLGLLLVPTLMLLAIARRRPPRRAFWVWLVCGGALIAIGPLLSLWADGWHTEVFTPGRWGTGSASSLSDSAPRLWGLATIMIVPGVLGLVRGCRASATKKKRGS